MNIFSFSRLNLFETCPRRFAYKYIEKLDDPAGPPAILGKTVHKAIELCLNGRSFEDSLITAYLEEADETVDIGELRELTQTALNYQRTGKLEQHFIIPLAEGIKLQGYIDVLDDEQHIPVITDWKTGWKRYGAMGTWQLPLYAAAVMHLTGAFAVNASYIFLRFKRVESTIITKDMAFKAKAWAIETAKNIQQRLDLLSVLDLAEAFPEKPSPECKNCPWSTLCLTGKMVI